MIYSKKNTLIVGWNKITETFLENRIHNPEDQIIVDLESQYLRKQKLTYKTNNHLKKIDNKINNVFYFFEKFDLDEVIKLSAICRKIDSNLFICSNLEAINKKQFIDLRNFENILHDKSHLNFFLFRLFDIFFSIIFITLLSPLFILIPFLIFINDGLPIFFNQKRSGINGNSFKMYKYRTMYNDTDKYKKSPLEKNDKRITKLGNFLRKTSLDELPQFFNVLKGDMSIVGPRPEMEFIVNEYNDFEKLRLKIKPGITGAWQVSPTRNLPIHYNVDYDIHQIINNSFIYNIKQILKTVFIAQRGF